MNVAIQIKNYAQLIRLHKPIGIYLLLWPTLWALWLACKGLPPIHILVIFVLGVIIMRSAGVAINDFADRHVDRHVARTKDRPLTAGKVSSVEAIMIFTILLIMACVLVMFLNRLAIELAIVGAALAFIYPFTKRYLQIPQLFLGLAYAWGVPMAFAATMNQVPMVAWVLYAAALLWPIAYDTMYAMVDRADDIKVGIKSTAILFGHFDRLIIGVIQILFLALLILIGVLQQLHSSYFVSCFLAAILMLYQQYLLKDYDTQHCFKAFLNNHWVGLIIFLGLVVSFIN